MRHKNYPARPTAATQKTQKVIVGSGASSSARPHVTPAATGYVKIHT
jgi:hypothetical protein